MILSRALLMSVVGALSRAACSSISVNSDYDSSADFSAYKTFSWMPGKALLVAQLTPVNPLLEGRLLNATRTALSDKRPAFCS